MYQNWSQYLYYLRMDLYTPLNVDFQGYLILKKNFDYVILVVSFEVLCEACRGTTQEWMNIEVSTSVLVLTIYITP